MKTSRLVAIMAILLLALSIAKPQALTYINQLDASSQPFGQIGIFNTGTNYWDFLTVPTTANSNVSNYVVLSSQNFKPGTTQKYWQWTRNGSVVVPNPSLMWINQGQNNNLNAYFQIAYDATIQCQLVSGGSQFGTVDFKDPWLLDATSTWASQPVNAGLNAVFHSVPYSQNNVGVSTSYKGVFLGQNPYYNSDVAGYSVNASSMQVVNGYIAFFAGWTCSPVGSVSFQNPSSLTTALAFNSSGATITAQYSYSTVSVNATIPSGTWTMNGTVTVSSGVTLTASSGATLNFPYGASLVVNGALIANGVTFTRSGSNNWYGITINANGSSLTNCTISYADRPLAFVNVSTASVSGGTINNSTFSSSQAILISSSTPAIDGIYVEGNAYSSNGVRFTSSSGGRLNGSEIYGCGAGNGVIVEGGSSPTISANWIHNNYYNGIWANNNGSATTTVRDNVLDLNGIPGGQYYCHGINASNSVITATLNDVQHSNWGIVAYNTATVTGGSIPSASNRSTNCNYGMLIYNYSNIQFGRYTSQTHTWTQACNTFFSNASWNVQLTVHSWGYAQGDYWGVPGQAVGIHTDGTSAIDAGYPLYAEGDCYDNGDMRADNSLLPSVSSDLGKARVYHAMSDVSSAKSHYLKTLTEGIPDERKSAFGGLYTLLRDFNDPKIDEIIRAGCKSAPDLKELGNDLLLKSYIVKGRYEDAKSLGQSIASQYRGKDEERDALIQLSSLRAFDSKYEQVSTNAVRRLQEQFASSVQPGFFAAFGFDQTVLPKYAGNLGSSKEMTVDSVREFRFTAYPNPFNPSTILNYQLPAAAYVTLRVYDMLGRTVATLVDGMMGAGEHAVTFDGSKLSSGMYLTRISVKPQDGSKPIVLTKKIVLTK